MNFNNWRSFSAVWTLRWVSNAIPRFRLAEVADSFYFEAIDTAGDAPYTLVAKPRLKDE